MSPSFPSVVVLTLLVVLLVTPFVALAQGDHDGELSNDDCENLFFTFSDCIDPLEIQIEASDLSKGEKDKVCGCVIPLWSSMPKPANCQRFVSSDELALFGYILTDTYECDPETFKPPPPPGHPAPSPPTDTPTPPAKSIVAEYGTAKFNHEWTKITFEHTFLNPVVFVGPMTFNGVDISVVRVKDVTPNSFKLKLTEAPNHDGAHTLESADWVVFEEGKYNLDGCHNFEVGRVRTSKTLVPNKRDNFQNLYFTNHYETTPVVLTTIQTENDSHYVAVRQHKATVGSVKVALEREEANKNQHGEEIIGYVAFAQTRIVNFGKNLQVSRTSAEMNSKWHPIHFDDYSSKPFFIASLSTYYGADPAHLRKLKSDDIDQVSVKVEEDKTNDDETDHAREVVSYIAIESTASRQGRGYLYATPGTGTTPPVPTPPTTVPPTTEATESSAPSYSPTPTPGNNSETEVALPGAIIFAIVFLMFLTFILSVFLVFIVLYVRRKLPASGGYARVMGNLLGEPLDGADEHVTLDEDGSAATPVSFPFDDSSSESL